MKNCPLLFPALCLAFAFAVEAPAVETQTVTHDAYAEFNKGEPKGVAISDKGFLRLSVQWKLLADTDRPIVWAVARDAKGNLYAGGGNEGEVFKIAPNGVATQFFKADEIEVHALALDRAGNLFVGTSPDGKVYKVAPDGKAATFFEPGQKYIWALEFDKAGNLFVATGDKGIIFKVTPDGKGVTYYDSDETNISCLHWDKNGRLLAGSDPSGYLYRLTPPTGKGGTNATAFVVLHAKEKELKSIAAAADGTLYGAALADNGKEGAVYRVDLDGYAEAIWSSKEMGPFSLWLGDDGNLLVGTGDKGMVLSLTPKGETTTLFKSDASQITALLPVGGGKVIAGTSNLGTLLEIDSKMAKEGVFDSEVIDTKIFAEWGHARMVGEAPKGTTVELLSRSGNSAKPEKTWTEWRSVGAGLDGGRIQSPGARYVQYRVKMTSSDGRSSPVVDRVQLFHLPRNVAPKITVCNVLDAGFSLEPVPKPPQPQQTSLSSILGISEKKDTPTIPPSAQVRVTERPGLRTAVWKAEDPNSDELRFAVRYRAEGEADWRLLEEKLKESFYSWDSTAWADGTYYLQVEASDIDANPAGSALSTSEMSRAFVVDNTPPRIEGVKTSVLKGRVIVECRVVDATSRIHGVEYSVGGKDWLTVLPTDRLFDSKEESIRIEIANLPKGSHTILLHAMDELGNPVAANAAATVP